MKSEFSSKLEIQLNLDVNTEESCSRILQTAIGNILFQRDQIPFCFDLFKMVVAKFIQKETVDNVQRGLDCYQLKKQRDVAKELLDKLQHLFQEISNALGKCAGNIQVSLLFGSTIYTAKEAFVVAVPKINRNHYPSHHRHSLEPILKQLAMAMTLSDEIQPSGKISGPTNIFILLGVTSDLEQKVTNNDTITWHRIEDYQLPRNCHKYEINISHRDSNVHLHCCKEMEVFDDLVQTLHLDQDATTAVSLNGSGDPTANAEIVWYQIGDSLKGYKEVLIRGKSIWD